ncbi:hypothetical protein OH492_10300 [Vibrio chagasii]|nr:hypothetical protein [Vibrio chagasii]
MKKCVHGDKVIAIIRTEKEREVAEPEELLNKVLLALLHELLSKAA